MMSTMRLAGVVVIVTLAGCRLHFGRVEPDDAGTEPDGADTDASTRNFVFVSSVTHTPAEFVALGNGSMLAGGDAVCVQAAAAAGLYGTYVALLSDSQTNAVDRLAGARGWYRLDGLPFADTTGDLFGLHRVLYPVVYDELGTAVPTTQAFTGSDFDGRAAATCLNWTSALVSEVVSSGNTTDGSFGWLSRYIPPCNASLRVYCFGIDHAAPLVYSPQSGRRAFVSTPWIPGGGLAGADAKCQQEATTNGLTGVYLALLATDTASAAARMNVNGAPWVRFDGVAIAASPADLFDRKLTAAIDRQADGVTLVNTLVWSGGPDPRTPSANESCNNWTSSSGALRGRQTVSSNGGETFFTEVYTNPCSAAWQLYCLEQ